MNVLYIGNKNKKNRNNPTGLDTLSIQLSEIFHNSFKDKYADRLSGARSK